MILTLFESVQKAYTRPELILDTNWYEIAVYLTRFNRCEKKEDMMLFNLWEFDPQGEPGRKYKYENQERTEVYEEIPDTIRRCKSNAKGVWGLVLDFDGARTIREVQQDFDAFEYILYTTFRHTEDQHKFRVVLPLRRRASREEIRRKAQAFAETFQEVDHASFSESQSFYLHSGPVEGYAYYNPGIFLDPDWFEDQKEVIAVPKANYEFDGDSDQYKEDLIQSLITCSGLHYAGVGTNHGVLTLVALCKSAHMTYEDFNMICANIADSTSSLQQEKQRKAAWKAWAPFNGITAKVREDFIKAYGGTSRFGRTRTSKEILEEATRKYGEKK